MRNMNALTNVTSDEDVSRSQREDYMTVNLTSTKVYKKSAQNNKITLYLGSRDLIISNKAIDKIQGVVYVDPDYLQDKKVFGQVTLTFRYGREDEEVMGLKFCNEAIMCLAQLFPAHERFVPPPMSPLQEALIKRLGENAHAFTMEVTPMAPPSVQLVPAKEYNGAPIGTSYDVRVFVAHRADEKLPRRNIVRMGIRVIQLASMPPKSSNSVSHIGPTEDNPPHALINKPFLLTDGKVRLEASLDKSLYSHGDSINVNLCVVNNTKRSVRRIKIFVIQHVDVCMFSNGKFKNTVATIDSREDCPIRPGCTFNRVYVLNPAKGVTKNWIALEDSYVKVPSSLASTVICNSPDERNVFAIYVSYYVKVKLIVGAMRGKISVKLPFTLTHSQQLPDEDVLFTQQQQSNNSVIRRQSLTPPPSTSAATTALIKLKERGEQQQSTIVAAADYYQKREYHQTTVNIDNNNT